MQNNFFKSELLFVILYIEYIHVKDSRGQNHAMAHGCWCKYNIKQNSEKHHLRTAILSRLIPLFLNGSIIWKDNII